MPRINKPVICLNCMELYEYSVATELKAVCPCGGRLAMMPIHKGKDSIMVTLTGEIEHAWKTNGNFYVPLDMWPLWKNVQAELFRLYRVKDYIFPHTVDVADLGIKLQTLFDMELGFNEIVATLRPDWRKKAKETTQQFLSKKYGTKVWGVRRE